MAESSGKTTLGSINRGGRIGRRVMALVALAVLISVSLISGVFIWVQSGNAVAARHRSIEATAYVFASAVAGKVEGKDPHEIFEVLRAVSRLPDITYVAVVDTAGQEIASMGSTVLLQDNLGGQAPGAASLFTASSFPVAVDIVRAGEPVARLVLVADISDLRRAAGFALLYTLLSALAAAALGMLVASRLQRRITAPIVSLTSAMQEVKDTKNFATTVTRVTDDETGALVDTFNDMLLEINQRDAALESHRRNLEATVEQRTHELNLSKEAAESANRAKSSFLATMSHEIRTPMNGLMVMAELLAAGGLDRRQQRYAEVIVKSGQSLLTIINDILDLSKIEAGKLELEKIDLDPVAIADDVVSLFWERAASKGLDLAARAAHNVPRHISGDPVRLNQVLSNLVNNALKFTDKGQVLISLAFDRGQLHLTVTDSGIGIPQDKIQALFSAFSQADQTITRKFGGTGLGLAICKKLAESMDGSIAVASEPGKGASFRVSLPVSAEAPAASPPRARRIGLMIDGLATRSGVGTALLNAGYTVEATTTASGFDVLFIDAAKLPGVIILPGQPQPQVICVAKMGDAGGERALADGKAGDLLTLPLRHADLDDILECLAAGRLRGKALIGARTAPRKADRSFAGRRILVADDNAVNREVLIEVLRQLGVTVETAEDGREAVAKWRKTLPDLVFMDCSMPEMDGFAATREIRAHEHLDVARRHTPIIALTAHVAGSGGDEWRKAGMDAYMTKPFTMHAIVSCMQQLLAGLPPIAPEPEREAGDAVLDLEVLDDIRKIGGNDILYRRVLDIFTGKAPAALETLEKIAPGEGLKALADAAHALKSMCANIGARRAVTACDALELAARNGADFDAGEMTGNIAAELRLALAEVDRLRAA
jgi:two-component system sensor histidine kinase BarA